MVIEPNEKQMEKINKLNEFILITTYRMEEEQKRLYLVTERCR